MGTLTDTPNIQTGVTRALDTSFQISTTRPAFVAYTVELGVQAPLLSSQSVTCELRVSGDDPPVAVVDTAFLSGAQLAGLGLVSIATSARQVLIAWVQPNEHIKLVTSGSGSATLVAQLEVLFS